jgi:hypothetical protein
MRFSLLRLLPLTALTVAGSTVLAPALAQATPLPPSVSCSSTTKFFVSPGLTLTPAAQTLKVRGTATGCSGGGVTSAKVAGTLRATAASCTSGTAVGNVRVTWDTGATSKVHLKFSSATASATGVVTSGLFVGEAASATAGSVKVTGSCTPTSPVVKVVVTGTFSL